MQPRLNGFGHSALSDMLLFQMKWTECLHGAGSLRETLLDLSALCAARVVHLHRSFAGSGRQRTIASVDQGARAGERPLTFAVGPSLLAAASQRPRAGTVWMLDDLDPAARDRLDDRCRSWLCDRGIYDVAAIPLDRGEPDLNLLELYFCAPLAPDRRLLLEGIAQAASAAWLRREKGRIARLLGASPAIAERLKSQETPGQAPVLSPSNPCRLTAAETRICQLIQNGHSTAEIAEQARICDSTLRTHLRNIYAKAEVSGHIGLVRLLLSDVTGLRATRH